MTISITTEELYAIEKHLCDLAINVIGPIVNSKKSNKTESWTLKTGEKKVDIVTKIDKEVELIIFSDLRQKYPQFKFIGEESYDPENPPVLTDDPTFIIDPIDGTTNFVHDFPFFCTSMGLTYQKKPVVGVIYNAERNLLVSATTGKGVRVNGEQQDALIAKDVMLSKSIVALQPGSQREGNNFEVKMDTYKQLLSCNGGMIHGARNISSSAMSLAYLALGYLDAYWDGGCYSWDVTAGWCILYETGGIAVGANPGEWDIQVDSRSYLFVRGGSSKEAQKQYVLDFWKNVKGELSYGA